MNGRASLPVRACSKAGSVRFMTCDGGKCRANAGVAFRLDLSSETINIHQRLHWIFFRARVSRGTCRYFDTHTHDARPARPRMSVPSAILVHPFFSCRPTATTTRVHSCSLVLNNPTSLLVRPRPQKANITSRFRMFPLRYPLLPFFCHLITSLALPDCGS